ncbi:hypothetical protein [Mycobacterium intracellulare]|uniref:Uncharacterized protein n=1 Tax=Mycobacterium intracellulare TaxID=1767 RepID=A0AAE4R959_MYCIT|nr:hypothetical protein [Mycobacterium intracellulare]MDV6975309.1 hypothetical protein [Mycobacterium intracellulare]MDV6980373.1 hypothetical protein [Mycobacterium intracellulare]MDV7010802.1 hypothetical protein [Mycobacterium intracellulare]MDV7025708.1 hypothetical protein [Mycobacterium intracellulare]
MLTPAFVGATSLFMFVTLIIFVALLISELEPDDSEVDIEDTWW